MKELCSPTCSGCEPLTLKGLSAKQTLHHFGPGTLSHMFQCKRGPVFGTVWAIVTALGLTPGQVIVFERDAEGCQVACSVIPVRAQPAPPATPPG
jgi:hypothetical protein